MSVTRPTGSRRHLSDATTRWLLRCGAAAGPVFVAGFLVQGALRDGYDAQRHPISALALGPQGWVQRVNFWTSGAMFAAGALGLARNDGGGAVPRSRWGPLLLATVGVGLGGAGTFATDPVSGYPPGSPTSTTRSPTSALHDAFSTPVFLSLPAAAAVYARAFARTGRPRWSVALTAAALTQLATFVAAGAGFAQQEALVRHAGLFQRVSVGCGFGWVTALCVRALRGRQRRRESRCDH